MSSRSAGGRCGRSADGSDLVPMGDLSHKQKSRTPDAPPEIIDIRSYVEDQRNRTTGGAAPFRLEYRVILNRNCCKNARGPRISVKSTNQTWELNDPGKWMKQSGVGAIYVVGPPSIWTNLWANAENKMNILKL